MPGALDGVNVLEIAQVMAIPICGVVLSDLGADVVKLEPPWGDAARHTMLPVQPNESKSFAVLNRGKRSVGLDIADERSRPAVEALVRWADVILVSVKSEDLNAYKIGYDDLRPLNPQMIYMDHVPLGNKGPLAGLGSYDLVVTGLAGVTGLVGKERNGLPIYTQPAILDLGTGYLSAMAVCAALYARNISGEGQRIETSLLATAMITLCNSAHEFKAIDPEIAQQYRKDLVEARERGDSYEELQRLRERSVRRAARGNVYYRYYRTHDSFISIGCLSPKLQAKFRDAIGISDPRTSPDFDDSTDEGQQQVREVVKKAEEIMRSKTTAEWETLLRDVKIPCGPVNFPEEAIHDPQVVENEYIIELDHELLGPYLTFAPPVRMEGTPTRAQGPSPPLARHTEEVLREAGLEPEVIASLLADGVAGARAADA